MTRQKKHNSTPNAALLGVAATLTLTGCGAPLAERVLPAGTKNVGPTFPEYRAADLNGRTVTVPGEGRSTHALVLVAFKRRHQKLIDRWLSAARPLMQSTASLDFLELPVLKRYNPLSRWFIDRGMRSGIKDSRTRARVVTLYLDKTRFRRDLSIPDEDSIHVFLVRRADRAILWRGRGEVRRKHLDEIQQKLRAAEQATL